MEPIPIDPLGDVRLTIQSTADHPQTFRLSSAILRLASPVFLRLLTPYPLESKRSNPPVDVEIREEHSSPFELLFDILHMKPLPQEVKLPELIKLAKVVDKYQCAHVCSFQAERWMKDSLSGYREDLAGYLGLAIAFRSHDVFNTVSIGLALTNRSNKSSWSDERVYHVSEAIPKTALGRLVPKETIKDINELTQDYVKQVLDAICDLPKELIKDFEVEGFMKKGHSRTRYCEHDKEVIGAYYTCLNQYKLIRPSDAGSLAMMYHLCLTTDKVTNFVKVPGAGEACTACDFAASLEAVFYEKVRGIMNSRPGLFLHDALPEGTVPEVGRGLWWNAEDYHDYGDCAEQISVLFGNILSSSFRTQENEISFEDIVGSREFR